MITLTVNQQPLTIEPLPGETLAHLLRERLRLTGTKIGCEEAECGACTVWVDGEPQLACIYPAAKAAGRAVVTIEGLAATTSRAASSTQQAAGGMLHPLQEAFVKHGAVQCGFCIPGQIMTAAALLQHDPDPAPDEVRKALKDTLCRCAGYPTIERAVLAAAAALRTGEPVAAPDVLLSAQPLHAIGTIVNRQDAVAKVTGAAIYTDDVAFPEMLHAAVRRAHVPHAIVRRIDISQAQALPGVIAILTAADIPGKHNHGLVIYDWPSLIGAGERVRYVGDAIAIVAAVTRDQALTAAALIAVEMEPQPVISDPVQARQPGSPVLHEKGNLLKHIKVRKGDIEDGFAQADFILERTYHTPITDHAFLEPECAVARINEEGRMEIHVGSQIPYADRHQVARALGWPEHQVRVIGQLMGGGFGGKEDIAGQIHAALLAHATNRPVKLLYDRRDSLIAHPKRHATQIRVKAGVRFDGRFTAIETELYGDTGAYASLGEKVMTRATTHSAGPYEAPHTRADCFAMYTNNPPAGAFRGFGVTQSAFAIESLVDELAHTLGIDPIELRRRNALRTGSITNTGQVLRESVGLLECLDKVEAEMRRRAQGDPFQPVSDPAHPHLRRAWGLALGYKNTGLGGGAPDKAGAEVELFADGTFEARASSAELGQGLTTVMQLIVAEEFQVSPDRVRALVMDTDLTPDGGPTTASRQTFVTGNAVRLASQTLREGIARTLAERYDIPPEEIRFIEGLAQVNGQRVPLGEVVGMMAAEGQMARAHYEYWAPETKPLEQGGDMHFAFSFAAQAAEVEVNTLTGEVRVLTILAATDVGKVLNPLGFQGQVEGGVIMGMGNCLTEHFIMEEGRVVTDRLARYRIPSIVQTPTIISLPVEDPVSTGPYGAKGVGEIVSIPTSPAITNAIFNAVGVRITRLPIDQEMIALALRDSGI